MGIIKVSLYQREIGAQGLNLTKIKELSRQKSDFLLLPEYFYVDSNNKTWESLRDKQQFTLDWLTKLSESYKGICISGAVPLNENKKWYLSAPVLAEGELVDSYKKNLLDSYETDIAQAGKELPVFILGGQRFAVLLGKEIYDPAVLKQLQEQSVRLVFVLAAIPVSRKQLEADMIQDEGRLVKIARDNNLHIVRCSATGKLLGKSLSGRSLVVNPKGVSWHIAPQETEQEFVKTITINVQTL